jgi:hypothetical protein
MQIETLTWAKCQAYVRAAQVEALHVAIRKRQRENVIDRLKQYLPGQAAGSPVAAADRNVPIRAGAVRD